MADLLLTGFEPFDGSDLNPSAEIIRSFESAGLDGLRFETLQLPVDTIRAPQILEAALLELRPTWCLMLGEARGRSSISIERVALNLRDFRIPDNTGQQVQDLPVVVGGPDAYFCTVPAREICAAIREEGVPAELSLSAGTYLCNQVAYVALHTAAASGLATRCGFIHVPALPEQAARVSRQYPSMSLDVVCRGLRAGLRALRSACDAPKTGAGPLHLAQ